MHIFARYSFCKREDLGALESCNLPLRLHSLQSCNTAGQSHKREPTKGQNKLRKLELIKQDDHAGGQEAGIVGEGTGSLSVELK